MATYLLLRNNKETGPYSLEALIQLGLKPYDLVWVEGKSAAWRYPSEVDGLKFYAAAVEEQPFDRFYKKPSEEKAQKEQSQQVVKSPVVIPVEITKQEVNHNEEQQEVEVNIPKKQVYVSMPANSGKTIIIKKTEKPAVAAATATTVSANNSLNDTFAAQPEINSSNVADVDSYSPSYSDLINDYNKQQYYEKKSTLQQSPVPQTTKPAESVAKTESLETKYSQSLDDIKDMYVQTLTDRKKKNAQRKMMMNLAKKGLPFAAVLIIGFMMGTFLMNKNSSKQTDKKTQDVVASPVTNDNSKTENTAAQANQQVQPAQTVPAQDQQLTQSKPVENNSTDLSKSGTTQKESPVTTTDQTSSVAATKKVSKKENKTTQPAEDNNTILAQPKSVETDPATGERNKVVRSDAGNTTQTSSKVVSNPLMKQVSVASNDYKRGTFGGIHDLQLTVTNNSGYLLDNVVVELQLLKPNDQAIKTDNIRFSPVPPNGSLTLAIPATNRGVKVAYRIIHVESKSASNDTAGLK